MLRKRFVYKGYIKKLWYNILTINSCPCNVENFIYTTEHKGSSWNTTHRFFSFFREHIYMYTYICMYQNLYVKWFLYDLDKRNDLYSYILIAWFNCSRKIESMSCLSWTRILFIARVSCLSQNLLEKEKRLQSSPVRDCSYDVLYRELIYMYKYVLLFFISTNINISYILISLFANITIYVIVRWDHIYL